MASSDYEYVTNCKEYRKRQARIEREIQQELDEEFGKKKKAKKYFNNQMSEEKYNEFHDKFLREKKELWATYDTCVTAMTKFEEWNRKQASIINIRKQEFYHDLAQEFSESRKDYIITSSEEIDDFVNDLDDETKQLLANKQLIQRVAYHYYDTLIDHAQINPYSRPEDPDHITIHLSRSQYFYLLTTGLLYNIQIDDIK